MFFFLDSKLTTLTFLLRGLVNASDLMPDDYIDDFADCSKCVLNPNGEEFPEYEMGNDLDNDLAPSYGPSSGPGGVGGTGYVPMGERHCTKEVS